jgi:hypothetical protein
MQTICPDRKTLAIIDACVIEVTVKMADDVFKTASWKRASASECRIKSFVDDSFDCQPTSKEKHRILLTSTKA